MKTRVQKYHMKTGALGRVYLVSDVHFDGSRGRLAEIEKVVAKERPDVVVIAGDFIDRLNLLKEARNLEILREFFAALGRPVCLGFGNHDLTYYPSGKEKAHLNYLCKAYLKIYRDFLSEIPNLTVLDNASAEFQGLKIAGITLPLEYYRPRPNSLRHRESREVLERVLKKQKGLFDADIVLIHSPLMLGKEIFELISGFSESGGFSGGGEAGSLRLRRSERGGLRRTLIVAGHTHSGAVPFGLDAKLPGMRGIISPEKKLFAKNVRGGLSREVGPAVDLLVLPALNTFSRGLEPLNSLFPQSHTMLIFE